MLFAESPPTLHSFLNDLVLVVCGELKPTITPAATGNGRRDGYPVHLTHLGTDHRCLSSRTLRPLGTLLVETFRLERFSESLQHLSNSHCHTCCISGARIHFDMVDHPSPTDRAGFHGCPRIPGDNPPSPMDTLS